MLHQIFVSLSANFNFEFMAVKNKCHQAVFTKERLCYPQTKKIITVEKKEVEANCLLVECAKFAPY